MKILVITGGTSSERKISLISAKAVKKALEENGHLVKLFDFKKGYPNLKKVIPDFDVIFPVIHGEEGEGGELQKFLSKSKKPYVGGDWKGFKKGWYKIPFKKFCLENKITTSPWEKVTKKEDIIKFGFPCVLKSSTGGSSKEVSIIYSEKDFKKATIRKLLNSRLPLFVEKFITGVEVTVGILDNKVLPVLEIIPPKGEWFDYKNKYSGTSQEIPNAPSLSLELQKLVQKIALNIHKKLRLGHYSRIDFIVSNDIAYVLEVNTIPGMTVQSLLPKAAQTAGISFPDLIKKLVEIAFKNNYEY